MWHRLDVHKLLHPGTTIVLHVGRVHCSTLHDTEQMKIGVMHEVRTRGIPIRLMEQNNHAGRIQAQQVLSTASAVDLYEEAGGQLRTESKFGEAALADHYNLNAERLQEFQAQFPKFENLFSCLVNIDPTVSRQVAMDTDFSVLSN